MQSAVITSPRWRKLGRDLWTEKNRMALMIVAISVSLIAVGTVLGSFAILTREIAVNYLGTRPASATVELEGDVDAALVERVRRHPAVREAEARDVILARFQQGGDWRPLLLFVVDDFAQMRLNTLRSEGGAWPPPTGTMLVERSAVRGPRSRSVDWPARESEDATGHRAGHRGERHRPRPGSRARVAGTRRLWVRDARNARE